MRRWILASLAVLMLWPASAAAQDEEAGPTWWVVFSEHVSPANAEAFEAASAEFNEVIKANAPADMVFYTLSGPETGYMYAVPMTGMEDFSKLNQQWMGMINKIGWDKWEAMSAKSDPMVEYRETNFYVEMPDQSYHPEGFEENMGDQMLRHMDYLYPTAGMEDEFGDLMKEWVALYKDNGIETGWTAYQAVTGEDLPMVVLITPAASTGDYYMMSDKVDEMLGDAGKQLMQKSVAMMRKFRHTDTWARPELSLVPDDM